MDDVGNLSVITPTLLNMTSPGDCAPPPYRLWWAVLVLLVVPVGGLYANSALWAGLWTCRLVRLPVYSCLLSLAAADILNCLLVLPMAAIKSFLGKFPGSVYVCRVWLSADLLFTAASTLHLCLLCLELCLQVTGRCTRHQAPKLVVVWILACLAALGTVQMHVGPNHETCEGCVPGSSSYSVISGVLTFWAPMGVVLVLYPFCFLLSLRRQRRQPKKLALPTANHHDEQDIDMPKTSPRYSPQRVFPTSPSLESYKEPLVRKLSRRLSSRRRKEEANMTGPSSPKLDRHPSLRYSIKRTPSKKEESQKRRSQRRHRGGDSSVPLLTTGTELAVSTESMNHSAADEHSPQELDDQTICQILLAEVATTPSRSSSVKSSGRRPKRGSLSASPASPTLDRHPSLRYSTKRRRGDQRKGSLSRSPSIRSQHSCFSRSPSQRSGLSRTPSQRSPRRSPTNLRTSQQQLTASQQLAGPSGSQTNVFIFPDCSKDVDMLGSRSSHEHDHTLATNHNGLFSPDHHKTDNSDLAEQTPVQLEGTVTSNGGSRLSPRNKLPALHHSEVIPQKTPCNSPRTPEIQATDACEIEVEPLEDVQEVTSQDKGALNASEEKTPMLLSVNDNQCSNEAFKNSMARPSMSKAMDCLLPTTSDGLMGTPQAISLESIRTQTNHQDLETAKNQSDQLNQVIHTRQVYLLGLMTFTFICLHLPYLVTTLVRSLTSDQHSLALFISEWLAYCSSLTNPILVLAFHKDIFAALKKSCQTKPITAQ